MNGTGMGIAPPFRFLTQIHLIQQEAGLRAAYNQDRSAIPDRPHCAVPPGQRLIGMPPKGSRGWRPQPQTPEIDSEGTARLPLFRADDTIAWVMLDACDLDAALRYRWKELRSKWTSYAVGRKRQADGRVINILMHRLIMGSPEGAQIDHKDRNGLNNRRANLRVASSSQNLGNRLFGRENASSPFKGVWKSGKTWSADLKVEGIRHRLGSYPDAVSAALAYDDAAREAFGEFARTNFTPDEAADFVRAPRNRRQDGPAHGVSAYRRGCRCRQCTDAAVKYSRVWRARRKESQARVEAAA